MGIFDKLFNSVQVAAAYSPKNEQESWVAIMYSCIAADGGVSEVETDKMIQFLVFKKLFKGHRVVEDLYKPVLVAHKQIGSKGLIDSSVALISEDNKATLFAVVMELLLSDGILGEAEKEIAEYLSGALNLNAELASRIVEVMVIKNYGNIVVG